MEEIKISKDNALAALRKADQILRPVLVELFGINLPMKPTDIKTVEDAFILFPPNDNQKILLDYNGQDKDMIAAQALLKLTIVSRAINFLNNDNKIWEPDWSNSSEYKYYPWMEYKAGSGFSYCDYVCDYTVTFVGSRLCFKSLELARYAGKQFADNYARFFLIGK